MERYTAILEQYKQKVIAETDNDYLFDYGTFKHKEGHTNLWFTAGNDDVFYIEFHQVIGTHMFVYVGVHHDSYNHESCVKVAMDPEPVFQHWFKVCQNILEIAS